MAARLPSRFQIGTSPRVRRFVRLFDRSAGPRLLTRRRRLQTVADVLVALVSPVDASDRHGLVVRARFGPRKLSVQRTVVVVVFDVRRVHHPGPVLGHYVHRNFFHVMMVHVLGVFGNVYFDSANGENQTCIY